MTTINSIRNRNKIVRAVMYARFSSDMQREESIEAQVRAIRQYAETNGIVIVGEYYDRAKSGTSADRAEFQKMLKDATNRDFDLVLVHKVDRFARNRQDSMVAKMHLKRYDVTVIAVAQPYDGESPEGMMMEAMLEAFAEYYSRNLASEVEKGKRENALKGLHVGGTPPLGYDVDKETMKLVINEKEAEAVREIFKLALAGDGYTEIVEKMQAGGYKTKTGRDFGKNSLFSIMKNEKYTGTYIYSKSTPKDMDGKRNGHAYKDDGDIIRVENAVPVLVSKEDFERVQQLMHKRSKRMASYRAKQTYLLSGKIVCGECGSTYAGNSRRAYPAHREYISYNCTRKNGSVKCHNKGINRDAIEDVVLERLAALVFRVDLVPDVVNGYNAYLDSLDGSFAKEIKALEKRVNEVQGKIDNLVAAIATTGSVALADGLKQLEVDKADIESQLFIKRRKADTRHVKETAIYAAFKHAQRMLETKNLHNTKQLVQTFVEQVTVYKEHIEISFNLDFDPELLKAYFDEQAALREMFGERFVSAKRKDTQFLNCVSIVGGEGGSRTLATVSRPTPLAGGPLRPLEYFSRSN